MGGICPTDCTDLHGTKGIFIRQLRQLERQLKSIIPALSLLSYLLSILSFNIFRASVLIRAYQWEVIYFLALPGRNLINLIPRLAYAFSRFSEINCLTLSLAMLARYLNKCKCMHFIDKSETNQSRMLLYLLKIQRTNGVSASGGNLLRSTLLWVADCVIRFYKISRA